MTSQHHQCSSMNTHMWGYITPNAAPCDCRILPACLCLDAVVDVDLESVETKRKQMGIGPCMLHAVTPMKHHTPHGAVQDFSLSQNYKQGAHQRTAAASLRSTITALSCTLSNTKSLHAVFFNESQSQWNGVEITLFEAGGQSHMHS